MSLISELQTYDQYKNMTEREIRKSIGKVYGISRARNVELEVELDALKAPKKIEKKSSKKKVKSKSKNKQTKNINIEQTSQFLPELSKEVLLRADLNTLRNYCASNKALHNLCESKHFWIEKMQYNHLPVPVFDDDAIKNYKKQNEIKSNYKLYYSLYDSMLKNKKLIQDILLINKIESHRPYNKSKGIIKVDLDMIYEELGSDALLTLFPKESYIFYNDNELTETDNYSPNLLTIQLINNDYILKYTVLDLDTEFFLESSTKIDENELILVLGLIMFDVDLYGTDFDITDDKNNTFIPFDSNINPNSPLIGRESIWDTLKYLNV